MSKNSGKKCKQKKDLSEDNLYFEPEDLSEDNLYFEPKDGHKKPKYGRRKKVLYSSQLPAGNEIEKGDKDDEESLKVPPSNLGKRSNSGNNCSYSSSSNCNNNNNNNNNSTGLTYDI